MLMGAWSQGNVPVAADIPESSVAYAWCIDVYATRITAPKNERFERVVSLAKPVAPALFFSLPRR